jgi:hypothetical protein
MELKEFIKQSLSAIIDGVAESQEDTKDTGAIISPSLSKEGYVYTGGSGQRKIVDICFDVAVVVEDKKDSKQGITVLGGFFGVGVATGENKGNATSSKICFTIPVALPVNDQLKKTSNRRASVLRNS